MIITRDTYYKTIFFDCSGLLYLFLDTVAPRLSGLDDEGRTSTTGFMFLLRIILQKFGRVYVEL